MITGRPPIDLYVRLWDKIAGPWEPGVTVDDCWTFTGGWRSKFGYGRIAEGGDGGRGLVAHRVVYEQLWGPLMPYEMARHVCDNPPCCNPFHLVAGTAADNARDRVEHGYYSNGTRSIVTTTRPDRIGHFSYDGMNCDRCTSDAGRPITVAECLNLGRESA